ncbi:MAG: copper resistance protein [Proteobacteria bacterium]|nr:copper resistance protein [Pseudomonadota bacterium]
MRTLILATVVLTAALPGRGWTADGPTVVAVKVTGEQHETMTLEPNPPSVKAGRITFRVENAANTESHEMIVARVADPKAPQPYDEAKKRVIESKLQALGEVSKILPGQTKALTLALKPGKYLLVCNHTGHYKAGMVAPFEVTN